MDKKTEAWEAYCDDENTPSVGWATRHPMIATHKSFDAGYDSRNAEVERLRELLRQTQKYLCTSSACDVPEISLYDAIEAELAKE